jgi:hypothetical protein
MKSRLHRPSGIMLLIIGAALLSLALIWGCSGSGDNPVAPVETASAFNLDNPEVQKAVAIQERHTKRLMDMQDVIGTAVTLDADGKPAVLVLITSDVAMKGAASTLEDVKVLYQFTDPIVAMKGGPPGGNGGTSHKNIQTPPIQLGTSGGWGQDLANGFCCGGTLGALIQVGGNQRILSNYHVFEADIVNGGNGTTAQTGDPIIQPGLIDVNCDASSAQDVATLVKTSSLPGSNVDCSSANVISGMVRTDGAILEVGVLSSATVGASINQNVKKSGRTSGLTRSRVEGLNATVSVSYENECAGGSAFTKTFTGQILIRNKGSKFLAGGDSGSLMVEDVTTNPSAVGLLFAGSSSIAVANPIDEVLSFFNNASMVGN